MKDKEIGLVVSALNQGEALHKHAKQWSIKRGSAVRVHGTFEELHAWAVDRNSVSEDGEDGDAEVTITLKLSVLHNKCVDMLRRGEKLKRGGGPGWRVLGEDDAEVEGLVTGSLGLVYASMHARARKKRAKP